MFSDSFATPWTVACHALLSMGFFRQEYLNGLPFPPPGDLPDSGIKPRSPVPPELLGGFFTPEPPGKARIGIYTLLYVRQITNKDLLYSTENYTQYFVKLYKGKESKKE